MEGNWRANVMDRSPHILLNSTSLVGPLTRPNGGGEGGSDRPAIYVRLRLAVKSVFFDL